MPEEHVGVTFWDHITEFIKRMKVVLATFLVSILVLLVLPGNSDFFALTSNYKPLMSVLVGYINKMFLPPEAKFFASSMSDPITLYVYAALVFAIGITLPVFAYEAFKFINPALYPHERKAVFPFVSAVTVLFVAGAVFGFFFLAPSFVQGFFPFYKALGVEELVPIMDFYNMVFFTIIVSGVLFTIPAFFVLLVKFGVIHTKMFAKKRKYLYAGIAIIAMLISPGATPQGDLYLFIALAALFEVSMLVGRQYEHGGTPENVPAILKIFTTPKCKFCHSEIEGNLSFCPKCRKSIN